MMKKALLLLAVLALGVLSPAAITVFSDNFDSERGGVGITNYFGFANWNVTDGSVDLIGNGLHDFLPGNGLYVDMDGSTQDAGKMTLKKAIPLQAGTYVFSYELAGNHRNIDQEFVNVNVNIAGLSFTQSLKRYDPFTPFAHQFTLAAAQDITISFEGVGNDNMGMLLDDVKLVAVPAPGAILLGAMGTSLVGWLRRRRSL